MVNSFFASCALCLHSGAGQSPNPLNPMSCLPDAGFGMCSHYNTLYNTYTYYIASLILVSKDLEIEESGQKGYSVLKIVFRKPVIVLSL